MQERQFDIVLYGATGFTGRQAAKYLGSHAPKSLRWAIAGRDRAKLEAIGLNVPILLADAKNQSDVDSIVGKARVLLTMAGPFKLFGDPFVDACVRLGTDYLDISGEPARIRGLIDRYHKAAEAARVRIVNFCGVSSAPADLAVWLVNEALGKRLVEAKGFVRLGGGSFSGGTIASISDGIESGDAARERDIFLLNPERKSLPSPIEKDPCHIRYDGDVKAWTAPSPMGLSDTRAIRRSGALLGKDIRYQEYLEFPGAGGFFGALGFRTMIGLFGTAMSVRSLRNIVRKKIPPGAGPSEKAMDSGWYEIKVLGSSDTGQKAMATFKGKGDAGNRITVRCVCEAALALALDEQKSQQTYGVLTPSIALGQVLVDRLKRASLDITVSSL